MDSLSIRRDAEGSHLEAVQEFPLRLDRVFPFFADASNLERITCTRCTGY